MASLREPGDVYCVARECLLMAGKRPRFSFSRQRNLLPLSLASQQIEQQAQAAHTRIDCPASESAGCCRTSCLWLHGTGGQDGLALG